jgi:hypothetical protein
MVYACYAIGIAMDNLNNKGYGQSTDWIMRYFLEELNYMRYRFVIRGGVGDKLKNFCQNYSFF